MLTNNDTPPNIAEEEINKLRPLWYNRDYLILRSGQAISSLGSGVSQISFPLLVLALTSSPTQAGFVGALRALPYLLFGLPAGAVVDRWDRKRVMIFCDAVRALSLGSIPIALALGHLTILQLYLTALIEGTGFVFFNLAAIAGLPQLVAKEQLPVAEAQNQAVDGIVLLLGPSFGTVLYNLSRLLPFLADAISYTISVFSLLWIKQTFQKERTNAPGKIWVDMREGLVWLWKQRLLRYLAILNGGVIFVSAGNSLIVIVRAQQLHASPIIIGLIFSIAGLGNILGALLAPSLQKRFRFGHITIVICWFFVLLWPLYSIAPSPLVLGAILAGLSLVSAIINVAETSYRLTLIPDELQGRVNGVFRLIALSLAPLGLVLTGVLLQNIGVVSTIVLLAFCLLALALITMLNPHVRGAC